MNFGNAGAPSTPRSLRNGWDSTNFTMKVQTISELARQLLGALRLCSLYLYRHVHQTQRRRSHARYPARLPDSDRTNPLQRLTHLAGKPANQAFLNPPGIATASAAFSFAIDFFCCSR